MKKKNKKEDYDRIDSMKDNNPKGNIYTFFVGIIVFLLGIFLVFQNTTVRSGFSLYSYIGFNPPFGLVLLPLLIGVIMLFFSDSIWGWILVILGLLIIVLGILSGLRITFKSTSLFETILMFGMVAAGIGITLRGLYGSKH